MRWRDLRTGDLVVDQERYLNVFLVLNDVAENRAFILHLCSRCESTGFEDESGVTSVTWLTDYAMSMHVTVVRSEP